MRFNEAIILRGEDVEVFTVGLGYCNGFWMPLL